MIFAENRPRRLATLLASVLVCLIAAQPAFARRLPPRSAQPPSRRALVGYFPQWGLYNDTPYTVKSLVQSAGTSMLDQLNYAQGFVTGGRCSVADPNADLNFTFTAQTSVDGSADSPAQPLRGNLHQLQELKRLNPRLRILISLEGHASDFAADAQPAARAAFVASCVDVFLRGHLAPGISAPGLFDGIDLDWEYPRGADAVNYIPLLEEFRRQMNALRPGLLLTVALDPSPALYGVADIARLGRLVDRAGLMTYDFSGPWSQTTGFIAPLASNSPDDGSVERSVNSWIRAGIPADKLLVGLPFYGYGWRGVPNIAHGFGQDGRPIRGDRPYRFIQSLIAPPSGPEPASPVAEAAPPPLTAAVTKPSATPPQPSATPLQAGPSDTPNAPRTALKPVLYRDPVSQAPWLFDGDAFWTYEDPTSIRSKGSLVARQQLGGFMVWELSDDTPSASLLSAARAALSSLPPAKTRGIPPRRSAKAALRAAHRRKPAHPEPRHILAALHTTSR